jgi:hypothetical protein
MRGPYREQLERVRRWYDRFAAITRGRPHDVVSENYIDDVYAFFLNCYHLKDWIRNDSSLPSTVQDDCEIWINNSRSLRICADLCNSHKHLVLAKKPRSNEMPVFGEAHFGMSIGPGLPAAINLRFDVDTTSGREDAFELATDCLAAWKGFLTKHCL